MPPRTNRFQRLILGIERQLQPLGAVVTESAMVPDRLGQPREVDILVQSKVGDHPIAIAVECRDHRKPCDVTWIEELHGRFGDMPIDKVVAVSKSGFTKSALRMAEAYKIRALNFGQAEVEDWAKYLTNVASVMVTAPHFHVRNTHYVLAVPIPSGLKRRIGKAKIKLPHRTGYLTIHQLIDQHAMSHAVSERIAALERQHPGETLAFTFSFGPQGWLLIDQGKKYPLETVTVTVTKGTEAATANLTPHRYGDAVVLHGQAAVTGFTFTVTKTLPANGQESPIHIAISFAGDSAG